MSIYTVNYQETFFQKPDLAIILGIPTYEAYTKCNLNWRATPFLSTPT